MTDKQHKGDSSGKQWFEDGLALGGTSNQSRREFIRNTSAVGLFAGFALAAQPVVAQNIVTTSTEGLNARAIKLSVNGAEINAYAAQPAQSSGKIPVIIVISEIFGVHEHIADVARRFAKLGYLAIAPDFFQRTGDPSKIETAAEIIKTIVSKTPDAQVMGDIRAALAWAEANGGDMSCVGVTGFCWGGRITWLACAQIPNVKAGVAWYGRLVGDASENFPVHPVDVAKDLKAPVLGLYGGQDTGIPLATVQQMQDALLAAKSNPAAAASRFVIYPDAPHAFHADYRPSFRAEAAKDGWAKCVAWFKENGV